MNKQNLRPYIIWLLVSYLAGHLMMSGHIDWQLTPRPDTVITAAFIAPVIAPVIVSAGPQESFGDGPGNR